MARWLALVVLPDLPDRTCAEQCAATEFGRALIRVESRCSWEVGEEEARARERTRRLQRAARGLDPDQDEEDDE